MQARSSSRYSPFSTQPPRFYNRGMPGQLYMIGTPIGNLQDLTPRAAETLKRLDLLYCEDTRRTMRLLAHVGAAVPLRPLPDDAPPPAWQRAIGEVQSGKAVGFVTEAGMPGVSDPGRKLVRAAWRAGHAPIVIPGPGAVSALLALCPFVESSFRFAGFPPRKAGERTAFVTTLASSAEPVFLFEAPSRVHGLIDAIAAAVEAEREILIGREMTKLHEQCLLFTAGQWTSLRESIPPRGEFTVAVAGRPPAKKAVPIAEAKLALQRLASAGFSQRDAVRALAAVWDLPANEIRRIAYAQR